MPRINAIAELMALQERLRTDRANKGTIITVCGGTGCLAIRSGAVIDALRAELVRQGLNDSVTLRVTGCQGFCEQGPIMVIDPSNIFYCHVAPEDVEEIVARSVRGDEVIERLLYTDPATGKKVQTEAEISFYRAQDRVLLSQNRQVDPCAIEDYFAIGGYSALTKVLTEYDPEAVIAEISASGLRGRGGGGFPTGRKWADCRAAPGDEKYVICNADEGDPGAFMDCGVLEGNPHAVLEGMSIGAWAIGVERGYVYVRKEYPLAVDHTRTAIAQAKEFGLLGENILGSGFNFDVEVARGGGAFVCGESTALMASIEGKVGEPRPKDVHTVEDGLWHSPTTLNNVETWANVPSIITKGAAWFAGKGTKDSTGTKIFALTGQVRNTGLVEVAMGTPLRKIIFDIGGGAANGRGIKAVQTGGPSGGCLPAELFDLSVDFETLNKAGSMVGSGGMVVMDDRTCMVDVAKYFLAFLLDESCGKCVPCRIGIDRMLEIVTDISEGRGRPEQIPLLEELAETVQETSLCALGKTAPNPVISTLRYFREEYMAHIMERRCPAGVCRELIEYVIDDEKCTGCGVCLRACPYGAISGAKKKPHVIDPLVCRKCGICADGCSFEAITVHSGGVPCYSM
jgi:NADH:ubiquinone oxidoreductase subunit F (NADH-binding)/(2Fe-2S) ferredoxin/Pyruvate/2-oxoacid:ferredoxin oxidoreductase delta subunit